MRKGRGFTLIELLVVIAIIGILATIVLTVVEDAKLKARDAKRIADLHTIGQALELFRTSAGHYPVATGWVSDCGHAGDNWIPDGTDYGWSTGYISVMPRDPAQNCTKSPAQTYEYWSDGQSYKVTTQLESPTPPNPPGGALSFDGFSFTPTAGQSLVATLSSPVTNPTSQAPIPFTATFSNAVIDFTQASLSVLRGFVSGFAAASSLVYNFFVTPTDNNIITVTLSAGTVHDQNGSGNTAAQYSINYNALQPHLALSPDPLPAAVSGAFTITLNSTVALSDFSASSVSVQDGTVSNEQAIAPFDGTNYSITIMPASPGTVTVSIPANTVHSASGVGNVGSNVISTTYAP
jgi:type II secretion system protein G